MKDKLLSISIASYNTESFINDVVRSLVIDDKYMEKLEIIIINDGSKDRTSEMAHALEREYPYSIVVIDKDNGGYGSTINASLSVATGKYYKLLDGDDWYNTNKLVGFLDYLEKCDSDIVVTPYMEVRTDSKLIDNHKDIASVMVPIESLYLHNKFFAMHELAIKTSVLKKLGKEIAEHCFYTDSEFVFYCFVASNTISRYNQPIYKYRLGVEGQSVSLQGIRKHYKDLLVVSNRIFEVYSDNMNEKYNTQKEIMDLCVKNITYHTFRAIMLMGNRKSYKMQLVEYDKRIKKDFPEVYIVGNRSKLVKISRMLKFCCYSKMCSIVLKRFINENGE